MYQLIIEDSVGRLIENSRGDLLKVVADAAPHVFNMDSYHKVRRELIRAGGAYASFFPSSRGVDQMPVQILIMDAAKYSDRQDYKHQQFLSRQRLYKPRSEHGL
jgi:hypothetical protein